MAMSTNGSSHPPLRSLNRTLGSLDASASKPTTKTIMIRPTASFYGTRMRTQCSKSTKIPSASARKHPFGSVFRSFQMISGACRWRHTTKVGCSWWRIGRPASAFSVTLYLWTNFSKTPLGLCSSRTKRAALKKTTLKSMSLKANQVKYCEMYH